MPISDTNTNDAQTTKEAAKKKKIAEIRARLKKANYDNTEAMRIIRNTENKDSAYYDKGSKMWLTPEIGDTRYDPNGLGFGIDVRYSSAVNDGVVTLGNIAGGRHSLSEEDERIARFYDFEVAKAGLKRRKAYAESLGRGTDWSDFKNNLMLDFLYNAGSTGVTNYWEPKATNTVPVKDKKGNVVLDDKGNVKTRTYTTHGIFNAVTNGTDKEAYEAYKAIQTDRKIGSRMNRWKQMYEFDENGNAVKKKYGGRTLAKRGKYIDDDKSRQEVYLQVVQPRVNNGFTHIPTIREVKRIINNGINYVQ